MRAIVAHHTDSTVRGAECNQILPEQPQSQWGSVGLGDLLGKARRNPVTPEISPHGRTGTNVGQELVLFVAEHKSTPRALGRIGRFALYSGMSLIRLESLKGSVRDAAKWGVLWTPHF